MHCHSNRIRGQRSVLVLLFGGCQFQSELTISVRVALVALLLSPAAGTAGTAVSCNACKIVTSNASITCHVKQVDEKLFSQENSREHSDHGAGDEEKLEWIHMIYGTSMNLLDCRVGTYLLHDNTGKSEIGRGQVGGDGVIHFFFVC